MPRNRPASSRGGDFSLDIPFYRTVRQAILDRDIIIGEYAGFESEMSPHVIGLKEGTENALFFQFAEGSKSGLPPGREWRCIHLEDLKAVRAVKGSWRTGKSHTQPHN